MTDKMDRNEKGNSNSPLRDDAADKLGSSEGLASELKKPTSEKIIDGKIDGRFDGAMPESLSGKSTPGMAGELEQAGAKGFIRKPFETSLFLEEIRKIIDGE